MLENCYSLFSLIPVRKASHSTVFQAKLIEFRIRQSKSVKEHKMKVIKNTLETKVKR
jgi:hypothetical protein